jgi:hypothetical protein
MKNVLKAVLFAAMSISLFGTCLAQEGRLQVNTQTHTLALKEKIKVDPPTKYVLSGTYLVSGNGNVTYIEPLSVTYLDDPLTVTCASTCSILGSLTVQTSGSISSNNLAVCMLVDGEPVPNGCQWSTDTPGDGTFVESSVSSWVVDLPAGEHTVQTAIASEYGCDYEYWGFQYSVYKP